MVFDTHAHYDDEAFDADRDAVLAAFDGLVIDPGCTLASSQAAVDLAARHPHVYAAVGIHPENCGDFVPEHMDALRQLAREPKVVAIGEIGLDFYWSRDFREQQTEAFRRQIELALQYDLPIAVHTRNAWPETVVLMREYAGRGLRGVFHAYSDTLETYRELRSLGDFRFGIGGVVTFKKSLLAAIVPEMELDDLVLETDCPYLTPAPHRGERNESAYVRFVCNEVARLKGLTPDEVADATTASAERLFRLNGSSPGQDGTKPRPAPAQGSKTDNQPHIQP